MALLPPAPINIQSSRDQLTCRVLLTRQEVHFRAAAPACLVNNTHDASEYITRIQTLQKILGLISLSITTFGAWLLSHKDGRTWEATFTAVLDFLFYYFFNSKLQHKYVTRLLRVFLSCRKQKELFEAATLTCGGCIFKSTTNGSPYTGGHKNTPRPKEKKNISHSWHLNEKHEILSERMMMRDDGRPSGEKKAWKPVDKQIQPPSPPLDPTFSQPQSCFSWF